MIEGLFNEKIENGYRISINPNEIYNQFILYMFFSLDKNIVLVSPTLSDANKLYARLSLETNMFDFVLISVIFLVTVLFP